MARRRHYRRQKFKLKLKKTTIYSIFSFGLIISGLILLLSFSKSQPSFILITQYLNKYFGSISILFPITLILLGFLFLKLRFFLSRPNVSIGFLLLFLSLDALLRSGAVGEYLFSVLADVLTEAGANLVYFAGIFVGIIVFFDTSIDELISAAGFAVEVNLGPAVTQYALEIAQGTKVSKITSLVNDLALATEAPTGQIRIETPIPGRNLIGIEIPNRSLELVTLKTMLESDIMNKSKSKLTVSLGLDVSGNPVVANIAKMPHVLIAGTTGSGKSVLINSFISSLLFRASPSEVKLILIDPKRV